jgi:hypothetical protein
MMYVTDAMSIETMTAIRPTMKLTSMVGYASHPADSTGNGALLTSLSSANFCSTSGVTSMFETAASS